MMRLFQLILLCILLPSVLQAALIAHYDFSDGELLDNEVGADYTLRAMKPVDASQAKVYLNQLEGSVFFPGGGHLSPWLEADGPGTLENFTVSFWFRTDQVRQQGHYEGLFASDTDGGDGNWMVFGGNHSGGVLNLLQLREATDPPTEPHEPNVWQHVVVRRIGGEQPQLELTITPLGGKPGEPVSYTYHSTFEKVVLGNNNQGGGGYRMELANVKIFDDSMVSVGTLFGEGPGVRSFDQVPLSSIPETLRQLEGESARLRDEIKRLPQLYSALSLDAFGYHSDYLPALETLPPKPRWVVEIGAVTEHSFSALYLIPASDRRVPGMPGYGFPKRFRIVSVDQDGLEVVLADWRDRDYPDPGRFPAVFLGAGDSLRKIFIEVYRGVVEGGREFFALDEALVRADYFVLKTESVKASGSFESLPFWSADYLMDERTSLGLSVHAAANEAMAWQDFVWTFPDDYSGRVAIDFDFGENRIVDLVTLFPARAPEGVVVPGYGFPGAVGLQMHAATAGGGRELVREVKVQGQSNPGYNTVRLLGRSLSARWLRLIFEEFPKPGGRTTFAMGEIDVERGGESIGRDAEVRMVFLDENREVNSIEALTDGHAGGAEVMPLIFWLDGLSQNRFFSHRLDGVVTLQDQLQHRWARFWTRVRFVGLSVLGGVLLAVAGIALVLRGRHARKMQLRIEQEHRQTELEQTKLRFFTHISHELRTPLTVVVGCLETLLNPQSRERSKHSAFMGFRSAKRIQLLVDQMLDIRRNQEGLLEIRAAPDDVIAVVRDSIDRLSTLAEGNGIELIFDCRSTSWPAVFDAEKLRKIIINLLANAIKYTPEGGRVNVSVRLAEEKPAAISPTTNNQQPSTAASNLKDLYAVITVEDNGSGIAPEDQPHIFEQFYRADGLQPVKAPGSGIGLALVKDLVDLWGGRIAVESPVADGQGTNFTVTLPVRKREI